MNGSFAPAFRRNHSNCKRECNGGDLQREVAKVLQSRYWVVAKESCNASHTETTNGQNEETAKHQDEAWRPFGVCSDDVGVGVEYGPGNQRSDDRTGSDRGSLLNEERDDHTGDQPGEHTKLGVEGQDQTHTETAQARMATSSGSCGGGTVSKRSST
jgi:hypothetical protein